MTRNAAFAGLPNATEPPIPFGKFRMEANFAALMYLCKPTEANARYLAKQRIRLANAYAALNH